jgi:hypothetical protein
MPSASRQDIETSIVSLNQSGWQRVESSSRVGVTVLADVVVISFEVAVGALGWVSA